MISKNIFKILFVLTGLVSLYIGFNFFMSLHRYFELTAMAPATFDSWEIEEVRENKFIVVTSYHFEVNGATYHQRYPIQKPIYPNRYLAQEHLENWKAEKTHVWFNPKNPHQSSIFRTFPFKQGIHLLLCIGVLFYFLWLNFYVKRIQTS